MNENESCLRDQGPVIVGSGESFTACSQTIIIHHRARIHRRGEKCLLAFIGVLHESHIPAESFNGRQEEREMYEQTVPCM